MTKYLNGAVSTEVCTTHYGHTTELGHLRMSQSTRANIAGKLTLGVSADRIIEDIRSNIDTSFDRTHLINKKDIANIERAFGIKTVQYHPDDATSTKLWVEEMRSKGKANPVLFYKQQGIFCDSYPDLKDDDFVLVLQTPLQSLLFKEFGTNIICIDSTHKITGYDFILVTLLVVDEFGEGYPIAWCISNCEDEVVINKFYSSIKEKAEGTSNLCPKWIMTDDAEQFYTSWVSVFGNMPHKLLCSWHVERAWRANLSKVKCQGAKSRVYHALKTLLDEVNIERFNHALDNFVDQLCLEEKTKEYGDYFKRYYYPRKEQWATCYRRYSGINTNMNVESFHRILKYIYFKGKMNKRVDMCVYTLLKIARDKAFERLIKLEKGKPSLHTSAIRKRHQESLKMSFALIECQDINTWKVQSSSDPGTFYEVIKEETCYSKEKCCLKCSDCNVCIHQFVCGCPDSLYRNTICKHIHLVARSLDNTDSSHLAENRVCSMHEPILEEVQQPHSISSGACNSKNKCIVYFFATLSR